MLNAFRHRGEANIGCGGEAASGDMCSTPSGIEARRTAVAGRDDIERVACSTPSGIEARRTLGDRELRHLAAAVLNAFRHRGEANPRWWRGSWPRPFWCSTPSGIEARRTPPPASARFPGPLGTLFHEQGILPPSSLRKRPGAGWRRASAPFRGSLEPIRDHPRRRRAEIIGRQSEFSHLKDPVASTPAGA